MNRARSSALPKANLSKLSNEEIGHRFLSGYISFQNPSYRVSNHTTALCNALQNLERGRIRRLIISMPPRHGKTMHVSDYFPAWYMGRNPSHQIIAVTYNFERAGDVGRLVRNQFVDPLHQMIFPNCHISHDSKSVNKLSTLEGGNYYSVGVGGTVIGRGANLFIIDDPIKGREEAESSGARAKLQTFYRGIAYTRLQPDNRIVLVMTRWHFDDLAGWLLTESKEHWHTLVMPAVAEDDCLPTKRRAGEALWASDYPSETLLQIKRAIGSREWLSQYQQKPLNEDGDILKLGWFGRYNEREWKVHVSRTRATGTRGELPFGINQIVMSWDTAFKEEDMHNPSSCSIWGVSKSDYYLLSVFNKRMGFPKLKDKAINLWHQFSPYVRAPIPVLIEDKASGQSLIQVLKKETRIPIIPIKADKGKQLRAAEVSPVVEAGRVHLPVQASWLERTETQISQFPLSNQDDDVDSITQFLRWVSKSKLRRRKVMFWK